MARKKSQEAPELGIQAETKDAPATARKTSAAKAAEPAAKAAARKAAQAGAQERQTLAAVAAARKAPAIKLVSRPPNSARTVLVQVAKKGGGSVVEAGFYQAHTNSWWVRSSNGLGISFTRLSPWMVIQWAELPAPPPMGED